MDYLQTTVKVSPFHSDAAQVLMSLMADVGYESFEEKEASDEIAEVQIGIQDGNSIGYALRVEARGYDGMIELMVGVTNEGVVEGIKILSHTETPGLGANAANPSFTDQFKEKHKLLSVTTSGNPADDEISAITGATITTDAVIDGVNKAIEYVQSQEGGSK